MIFQLLVLVVLGLPVAWKKVRGGLAKDFVGYHIDVERFELGLSQGRAEWLQSWMGEKLAGATVRVLEVRQGLGRLGFAAGPLMWMRPYLGPVYAWVGAFPPQAALRMPVMFA